MALACSGNLMRVAFLSPILALGACESATRLGSLLPDGGFSRPVAPLPQQAPPPLAPAPSTDVDTSTLPPPPGSAPVATAPLSAPQQPAAPAVPPAGGTLTAAPGNLPVQRPAAPPAPQVATAPVAPSRTAVTGNWSLAEAAGNRCRITLSSAPKLDLYGAGTSGCQAKELQRVNAWELSGSEVILYEPGGAVVARLRNAGGNAYSGVSTRSGAPITMSK